MIKNYLELAIRASVAAGKRIMDVYTNENIELEVKDDNSPLTKADRTSNAIINNFLETTAIPIISEENKEADYAVREGWERCWIVDPLDGTKEFIKRNGEFTVNIALIQHGKPLLGVIFTPVSRELYYADVAQKKAYKVVLDENFTHLENWLDNSLRIKPNKRKADRIKIVGSRSHMNKETKEYIGQLRQQFAAIEIVPKGSSLKFCMVAEGKADLYPRFGATMEWDTAAGQAICEAVGLRVISIDSLQNLTYNKPNLLNSYFIVE